ncbi:MAG: hypothetical protein SGILL_005660 [Bacillariaceae sp.]
MKLANANGKESLRDVFTEEELQILSEITASTNSSSSSSNHGGTSAPPTCPSVNGDEPLNASQTSSTAQTTTTTATEAEESNDDRRARLIAETATSYDCMEREFDALDDDFDPHEAAKVYHKCRLLVVRNVFTKEQMEVYRHLTEDFVVQLHHSLVDKDAPIRGPNKHGEEDQKFYSERNDGKWEILHPDYFLERGGRDFALNDVIFDILSDPYILGDDATFGGSGALLNEPYTIPGHWHTDDTFIFGADAHNTVGIAGHDIPSVAVNLATPLVELSADSGLTEYCLGTSHLAGVSELDPSESSQWKTHPQVKELLREHETGLSCPPSVWRAPSVKPGDVILWDYLIKHRAGANLSNATRPLLFSTYGRGWYSDDNFTPNGMGNNDLDEDTMFLEPRFMADVEDPYGDCHSPFEQEDKTVATEEQAKTKDLEKVQGDDEDDDAWDDDDDDDDEDYDSDDDEEEDMGGAKLCKPPTNKLITDEQGHMADIARFFNPKFDKLSRKVKPKEEDTTTSNGTAPNDDDEFVRVTLSNKDVPDAKFVINGGEREVELLPSKYKNIRVKEWSDVAILSGGKVVQTWMIHEKTIQIVISQESVGLV